LPNRATAVETPLPSHTVTIPSLFSPPPPPSTTTTEARPSPPPSSPPVNARIRATPGRARRFRRRPMTPPTPPRHPPRTPSTTPPTNATSLATNAANKAAKSAMSQPPNDLNSAPSTATSQAPNDPNSATSPTRTARRMVGRRGLEELRGGEGVQGVGRVCRARGGCAGGRRGRSPGLSTTTKREGTPMVPPIPASSLWLVPAACTMRRCGSHTPPRFLSFVYRRAARRGGGGGRRRLARRRSPDLLLTTGGNDVPRRCPPGVLDDNKQAGWHICAPWFLPAASSTGAGVKPTRRSLLNSLVPHWRG